MRGIKQMEKENIEKMKLLFRTVSLFEEPFTHFPRLIELQNLNGLNIGESYKSDKQSFY